MITLAGQPFVDGTLALALVARHAVEVRRRDAVLPLERRIASTKPPFVADLDQVGAPVGPLTDAEPAVGSAPAVPNVEVGVWPLGAAGAADDWTLILDRNASGIAHGGILPDSDAREI